MDKKKELDAVIAALKGIYQIAMEKNELNIALQTQKALASVISQTKDKERLVSLAKLTDEEIRELIQEGENQELTQDSTQEEEKEQISKSHKRSPKLKEHPLKFAKNLKLYQKIKQELEKIPKLQKSKINSSPLKTRNQQT